MLNIKVKTIDEVLGKFPNPSNTGKLYYGTEKGPLGSITDHGHQQTLEHQHYPKA